MKHLLALILSLVTLLTLPATAFAADQTGGELEQTVQCKEPIDRITFHQKIKRSGKEDRFKFRPIFSGLYDIYTEGALDTYGYLYDKKKQLLAEDNDSGSESNFKITKELSAKEWYYVGVKANDSSDTGPYTLTIEHKTGDDHGDSMGDATRIDIGSTNGKLEKPNDVDFFAFTPTTTGSFKIYTTGSTNTCGYLWDSDQKTQLSASYRTPVDENFCLARTLEGGKTYYISVCPEERTVSGDYTLWVSQLAEPTDTEFQRQWAILNRGVDSAVGKDINVLPVWEYTKGSGVKIGILDSGVAMDHEDLRDHMDSSLAYNFIHCNKDLLPALAEGSVNNHGTNVAGIAAAGENGIGIVGVAPEATIVPMALAGLEGTSDQTFKEAWISAIYYAAEHDIGILNMSFGGIVDDVYAVELRRTIEEADHVLFVAAAGNDGSDISNTSSLPEYLNTWNMITVANSDRNGALYPSSNYGSIVHIAAPGQGIVSSFAFNMYGEREDNYGPCSGTSMAAPEVSGVAALIKSYYPDISVSELKERIIKQQNVSYDAEQFNGKVASSGILNAWYAFCDDSVEKSLPVKSLSRPVDSNATVREENKGELPSNVKERIQKTLNEQIKASEQASNCQLDCITINDMETKENVTLTNRIYVNIKPSADKDALIAQIAPNARKLKDMYLTGSVELEFDSIKEAIEAVTAFNANDAVLYAEPVYNTPSPELY